MKACLLPDLLVFGTETDKPVPEADRQGADEEDVSDPAVVRFKVGRCATGIRTRPCRCPRSAAERQPPEAV
jgi:hypothetical protein